MTTQNIHTYPKFQAFDANGDPLNGGKLYTYANGTSTPKTTYADKDGATPNPNPVVLDSRGEAVIYGSGYYKFVLKDSADTTIWTIDDLIMGNVGSDFVSLTDDYENDLVAAIADISTTQTTSGLGGDELFWGYSWVRDAVRRNVRQQQRRMALRWVGSLFGGAMSRADDRVVLFDMHDDLRRGDRWSRSLLALPSALDRVPPDLWMTLFQFQQWDRIPLRLSDALNRMWLVSNCLALADRTTMTHSIEMRLPLLDGTLIELVTGLRQNGVDDWRKPHKWLLIEAVKGLLPESVFARRKQGFTPPVHEWMRAVVQRYQPLLSNGTLTQRAMLKQGALLEFVAAPPDPFFAYKLVLLELWCRLFVDRVPAEEIEYVAAQKADGRAGARST